MRLAGVFLLLIMLVYGLWAATGDRLIVFLSPSSMIAVWGGAALILLIAHGKRGWLVFFRVIRFKSGQMDDQEKDLAGRFLETGSRAGLAMGLFWELSCIIAILMNMDDPAAVGPGMAMAILPLLYGIVLSEMVFMPMHMNLMQTGTITKGKSLPKSGLYLTLLSTLFVLVLFLIMVLSMSELRGDIKYNPELLELIRKKIGS